MANEFKLDNKEFKNKMKKLNIDVPNMLLKVITTIGGRALNRVQKYTPTKTKNLKRNWFLDNAQSTSENASIELINNVKYALPVEEGHVTRNGKSFVPGRFMLKRTLKEIENESDKVVEKEIQKFISSHGGD